MPRGYRYSRFCEFYRGWAARLSVTMRQAPRQGWAPIPPPEFWVGGSLSAPTVGGLLGIPDYSYANFFTFHFDTDTAVLS